jgi:thiol-disulfide isomerase/thioredoxin
MAGIVDVIGKYVKPYKKVIIIVLILIAFIFAIRFWMKTNNVEPNKFDDVANSGDRNKDAIIYFFHVDWCPHCKTALPEWEAFKNTHDGKVINGYSLKCIDEDCTDESKPEVSTLINTFKLESFPTVKMVRGDQTIDFDSKVTSTTLGSFANMMLGD